MKILPILKCLPLLPFAYTSSIKHQNKEVKEVYPILAKWSQKALKWMGYTLVVENQKSIQNIEGAYFVCNHQGTLDPCLITASSVVPISFISKKENESIPILGRWAKNIGCIHFDRKSREGNVHMLRETLRYLKRKQNVLIFPEGTRSKSDQMNPFKEKALQPAIMAKANIVPVRLHHAYCLDRKDFKGKQLKITYGDVIPYEFYKDLSIEELQQYVFDIIQYQL